MEIFRLAEDFSRRSSRCATLADITPILADAAREIGFDYFAMTFCDNLQQSAPRFAHLDTYPAVYTEVFVANHLYRIDPVLLAAQRRIGGFAWAHVGHLFPLQPVHREILCRGRREGLRSGYTVPANVPGEPCGAVSFASARPRRLTGERLWCADYLARTAFETSRRVRGLSARPRPVPHLAAREIQCLERLALGETDKQIARVLDISPETVRQYVKTARGSYRAATRARLIALALKNSHIPF